MNSLFDKHFIAIIIGPKKAGKSYMIRQLLQQKGIQKDFDTIVVLNPSMNKNRDYDFLQESSKRFVYKYTDGFNEKLKELIDKQQELIYNKGRDQVGDVLVILDDCANQSVLNENGLLSKFSIEHRHSKISFLIVGHRLQGRGGLPISIRDQSDYMIFLNPTNFNELEKLIDYTCPRKYKKELEKKIIDLFNTKYNFFMLKTREPVNERYYEGFDKNLLKNND